MTDDPNNPFRLWHELKRRKVIRVLIAYLAASYVILELTSIIAEPFGLPGWTIKLVFALLCALLVIVVILSWIFDITPEGIKKTGSLETAGKEEALPVPVKRKSRTSSLIIVVLLVAVGILAYPRLFMKDRLKAIRNEEGKISVSVMPFENLTGDSTYNVWQGGFQNLLISTLSNSEELQVRQYQTMSSILGQRKETSRASISPSLAREIARDLNTTTFIMGKILKSGNMIRLYAQLVNAETEDIYKTYQVDCAAETDVFAVADSLGGIIRNFLEITRLIEERAPPGVTVSTYTVSAEAFQYYISAWETFERMDLATTISWLTKAIDIDASFIEAYIFLSFAYAAGMEIQQSKTWCKKAYSMKDQFPVRGKLYLDHLYAYLFETPYEEIKYCNQILKLDEMNTTYWYFQGDASYKLEQYSEAVIHWEKALEIHRNWGTKIGNPFLYIFMGESLHQLGNHKRENEVYELGLSVTPNNNWIIRRQATCALSQGQMDEANDYMTRFRSVAVALNWNEARISSGLGITYAEARMLAEAETFYRKGFELDPENPNRIHDLAWLLISNDIDVDEGVGLAEKTIKLNPEDSDMLDTYGWGLYKQGKYNEAQEVLNKSWELRGLYRSGIVRHMEEVEKALSR